MQTEDLRAELLAAAKRLRESCLSNPETPDEGALEAILAHAEGSGEQAGLAASILIREVVEPLCDRFDPALAECYVALFSRAIARVEPGFSEDFLRRRYAQIRDGGQAPREGIRHVVVLSRVTLGADIAVTSVFLRAALEAYPEATVWFAGAEKNFQLFAAETRLRHWPVGYPRGASLRERLRVGESIATLFADGDALLLDPDSRISQLGLLPLAPLDRTLFFESRSLLPESPLSLSLLASHWCAERLGVGLCEPFLAVAESAAEEPTPAAAPIAVSLGVGGNAGKALGAEFEADLLRTLAASGRPLLLDAGAGGEEAERVERAIQQANVPPEALRLLHGSFAHFVAELKGAAVYIGYDSAGQHAAAALKVPGVTLFGGYVNERMFLRWQPRSTGQQLVLRVNAETASAGLLKQIVDFLKQTIA